MLIDENERLNNVLTESEYTDADILDLKERVIIVKYVDSNY